MSHQSDLISTDINAYLAQHERKELLRKFNPLGLAYTYYAPAALHLHVEGVCSWCAAHLARPS